MPVPNLQRYECNCAEGTARAYAVCLPDNLANSIDLRRNHSTAGNQNYVKTPCDPTTHVVVGGGCSSSEATAVSGALPYPGLTHWYCTYLAGLVDLNGWSICARSGSS